MPPGGLNPSWAALGTGLVFPYAARPGLPGLLSSAVQPGRATAPLLTKHRTSRQARSAPTTTCSSPSPVANHTLAPYPPLVVHCRRPPHGHWRVPYGGAGSPWSPTPEPGAPTCQSRCAVANPGRSASKFRRRSLLTPPLVPRGVPGRPAARRLAVHHQMPRAVLPLSRRRWALARLPGHDDPPRSPRVAVLAFGWIAPPRGTF
jgi:hypothetical protein